MVFTIATNNKWRAYIVNATTKSILGKGESEESQDEAYNQLLNAIRGPLAKTKVKLSPV